MPVTKRPSFSQCTLARSTDGVLSYAQGRFSILDSLGLETCRRSMCLCTKYLMFAEANLTRIVVDMENTSSSSSRVLPFVSGTNIKTRKNPTTFQLA